MTGKVYDHSIFGLCNRRQPFFEFPLDVSQSSFLTDELVNIFCREGAAFATDDLPVDGIGVSFRELQVVLLIQVFVAADTDDHGISAWDMRRNLVFCTCPPSND